MSIENNWAENLPKETIEEFMATADGHTLFKPEVFVEIGIPEDVVKQFTRTHYSRKTPSYTAVETLGAAIRSTLKDYTENDGWRPSKLLDALLDDEDERMAEMMAEELINQLIDKDVDEVSGYSPKETIFDEHGNIVESMDAIYGLDLALSMVQSLGLNYEPKMGRGFQYSAYCKALREYLDAAPVCV